MTMIERVARAICVASGANPDDSASGMDQWLRMWTNYVPQARAAIEAMREMSPAVVTHLQMNTEMGSYICANWTGAYTVLADYHTAMIDAALQETR